MKTSFLLAASFLPICLSYAAPIPGLFDTGLDAGGNPLPDGSVDPHYSLIQAPPDLGLGPGAFVALSDRYPLSNYQMWIPNSSSSKWIAPQADQQAFVEGNNVAGTYIYQLTFDLTGYDPASASISGLWATDNPGQDILINGLSTGITHTDGAQGYSFQFFSSFTITSGFVAGLNNLDFVVYNTPLPPDIPGWYSNPTGLRVELSGTVDPVPEPPSLTLLALGGLIAGSAKSVVRRFFRRRPPGAGSGQNPGRPGNCTNTYPLDQEILNI